jgi:hypothetical protein
MAKVNVINDEHLEVAKNIPKSWMVCFWIKLTCIVPDWSFLVTS